MFLLLGHTERGKIKTQQLLKQREENRLREEEDKKKATQ